MTERAAANTLQLPLYPDLALHQQDQVIAALRDILVEIESGHTSAV